MLTTNTFQNTLEFDLGITFEERIKNLNGSHIFFQKILMLIQKRIRENDFIKLSEERYENFLRYEYKQILADGEKFTLYRMAGKLFLNRKTTTGWEVARIY
jgi:hypothetical protein